jgi:tRNA 2-selenouridine synthase
MANHRGSVLGLRPGGQPSQKGFETRVSAALAALDPARPMLVEAESSKVGERLVPPALWKAMRAAPRLRVTARVEDRARYLCQTYADLFADLPLFKRQLALLTPQQGRARIADWHALAEAGEFETLVRDLIERHYDTRYAKHREERRAPAAEIPLMLDTDGLSRAADTLMRHLALL